MHIIILDIILKIIFYLYLMYFTFWVAIGFTWISYLYSIKKDILNILCTTVYIMEKL